MDLKNIFEQPLPILQVDLEKIAINIGQQQEGNINIKNIGGGTLVGKIICNTECIILKQESFKGNNINIEYYAVSSIYKSGEFIKSEITIISNGGEINIPIFITISNSNYLLCNTQKIYTLKEFYNFYLKNPKDAIRIFNSYEFMIWLKNIDFQHIDITERFLKDANKQRGIDNFFIISKIKQKAYFDFFQNNYTHRYTEENEIKGSIKLNIAKLGYFETDILIKNTCQWIYFETEKISNKFFDTNGEFYLNYKIITKNLKNLYERVEIKFKNIEKSINIEIYKEPNFKIILEKEYYETIDEGVIKIINNFNQDILIEILAKDTFIKFKNEKYIINKNKEIKFDIKLIGFLKAQMDFSKKPFISTDILIKAQIGNKTLKDMKTIFIGNSFI